MIDTPAVAPQWALDAGLDPPSERETLRAYATRLGIDAEPLFVELTDQTADMANMRLAEQLRREAPDAWSHYIEQHISSKLTLEQHQRINKIRWMNPWLSSS